MPVGIVDFSSGHSRTITVWNPVQMINDYLNRAKRWTRRTFSGLKIRKIDSAAVPDNPGEIRLFMVVRNESLRLPFLLRHYFSGGVDRAFVIDNNSTDDTTDFLLSRKCTHVFRTQESYTNYNNWIDLLLHRYGARYWCVVVDADELLFYPHREKLSIRELTEYLDRESRTALHCLLLDMYSDKPLRLTRYNRGDDPLSVCPFFDPDSQTKVSIKPLPRLSQRFKYIHGMRKRAFGIDVCLSKFPLIRFNPGTFLWAGTHFIEGASVAGEEGALLHFKYFDDFVPRVAEEVGREEHWDNSAEYKVYAGKIEQNLDLNLHYSKSLRFKNSDQLVDLGIMKTSTALDNYVSNLT